MILLHLTATKMIIKTLLVVETILLFFWGWLLMTDARFLAIVGLVGTLIAACVSIFTLVFQYKTRAVIKTMSVKQDLIEEKVDGKMDKLLEASIGKASADATVKGKDELIDVLKHIPALEHPDQDKPTDVIVKKNEDKLL